jgi:hypothetical protein
METPNWKSIVRGLMAQGVTLAKQAQHIGVAPSSMGDLATGRSKEPSGWAAVKLHYLHKRHARK